MQSKHHFQLYTLKVFLEFMDVFISHSLINFSAKVPNN